MKKIHPILSFIILFLVSCNPVVQSPIDNIQIPSTSITDLGTAYPVPTSVPFIPDYPYPQAFEVDLTHPDKLNIPKPAADYGVITGRLIIQGSNEPYLNSILVLGTISEANQPGYPPLIGYSIDSDPHAVQSKDGVFFFDHIPTGKYGIVLWSPLSTFLLTDIQTGETIFVEVRQGEITDIGTIELK